MSILDAILAQPCGARFFRADLHIHSFGQSHDVSDATMHAAAIIGTAQREGLSIVAIADHNEIGSVEAAIRAANGTSVLVVPSVELSTPQGHLLCYLPSLEALRGFYGQLAVADRQTPNSRCQQALFECLTLLRDAGGFGILAHVDIQSGFEIENPGGAPHKADVICHPALLGIELKDATSTISYADGDPAPERVRMGHMRIERLSLGAKQFIARVLNSDAHTLNALGKNASNQRRVTRYKMDSPSFDGLRVALEDADARVRIEEHIPLAIPRVLGISIEGGFLAGQVLGFSPNLNCIIGGRGTGKSTAFEAVRCVARDGGASGVVDTSVWPDELFILFQDQAGQRHELVRRKDCPVENESDPAGPVAFEVDCFGQGDAARIGHDAQANPLALLDYLDRFVDLSEPTAAEEESREQLLNLQTEIEESEQQVKRIPEFERYLETTRKQLAALQKPGVKELIELQRQLASEEALRKEIASKLQDLKDNVDGASQKEAVADIRLLADATQLTVGVAEFQAITAAAAAFERVIDVAGKQISVEMITFERCIATQMASWKKKESDARTKVDEKRRELDALKVPFDMSYITKLTKDEAKYQQDVKNLNAWKPRLFELRSHRSAALKARWTARDRIATLREAFAKGAITKLREALSDIQVSLKYERNACSADATALIIEAMGWRTNQQPRAAWLVGHLTVPLLLDAIEKNDAKAITAIKTPEGFAAFDPADARSIIDALSAPATKFALERVAIQDLPRLRVTKLVSDGAGGTRPFVKDFAKLSLGQQQSVLLALILSTDSDRPLIIDQPEDNLDGEFIYSTLVPVLRRAKERRQVIIVTHNPNVAVLGDAELIIVMRAKNDVGQVHERGSIDQQQTRDAACGILEGAREAFLRRAKMYGIRAA